jgi:hypothetical protein
MTRAALCSRGDAVRAVHLLGAGSEELFAGAPLAPAAVRLFLPHLWTERDGSFDEREADTRYIRRIGEGS